MGARTPLVVVALVVVAAHTAFAQAVPTTDASGHWEGSISAP
jgi:hypothetical protein